MSPTLKSTGVGHFASKFGEEGVDWCKPNFSRIWDRHVAAIYQKWVVSLLYINARRYRQTNHGTVTSISIGDIIFQRCHLKPQQKAHHTAKQLSGQNLQPGLVASVTTSIRYILVSTCGLSAAQKPRSSKQSIYSASWNTICLTKYIMGVN